MPDKPIGSLDAVSHIYQSDLFVVEQLGAAMKCSGQTLMQDLAAELEAHGGITNITWVHVGISGNGQLHTATIHYSDGTTSEFYVRDGYKGDTGAQTYVHFKYSVDYPTADTDLQDQPADWIGIYSGLSSTAPTTRTSYNWYKYKGAKGDTGTSITGVVKTSTSGVVDTYTIYFSDGISTTFNVTNGSSIASIAKTSTNGLIDQYTITLTDGNTYTFSVTNGKGIASIQFDYSSSGGAQGSAGATDYYLVTFNDGDTFTFPVYNGTNGTGAVSTVDGIASVGQDVPLLTIGNGAPSVTTAGAIKSRYFDATNSILYICTAIDTTTNPTTYTWKGSGTTVDANFSTTSTNPVRNSTITNKVGTAALNTTAQTLSGAINEHEIDIGSMSLNTTATDLTGAINEHESDISGINTALGSTTLPTTAQTITGAIDELHTDIDNKLLYFTSQTVNVASNSEIMRIPASGTDSRITTDTILVEMTFADGEVVLPKVDWTSYAGYIVFTGTCVTATTANVTLGRKGN